MLVDSHAHLDSPDCEDDLELVLQRALDAGLEAILTIGCLTQDPEVPLRLLELIASKPYLYAAFGVHPHDAGLYSEELEVRLARLLDHPNVLGLGEIGLDFYYDNSPREVQIEAFRRQIRLAKSLMKPVIIHTREAEAETIQILEQEFSAGTDETGIMHCFTGSQELAERTLSLGFHISFGGILTFKNADELRKTAVRVPQDRLLIETDSPYLAPVPHRGKRNEPAYVRRVAEQLALLKERSTEEMIRVTGDNFGRLFGLDEVFLQ
jgi:TatD DNase family protein